MLDKRKKIGIGVVAVILCAVAFYFLYWVKTPAYSLKLLRDAVQKHDVDQVEAFVDWDTLLPKAFDDSLAAYENVSGEKLADNPLAMGFVQAMKPQVVSAMKQGVTTLIRGDQEKDASKASQADQMAYGMTKNIVHNPVTVKDVSTISKEGREALVAVKLQDKKLEGEYTVKLKMAQKDDGKWRIKEISNLADVLQTVDQLTKDKLAKLNAPIREQIDQAVTVENPTMTLRSDHNPFFENKWIVYKRTLVNHTDKDIVYVGTVINIKDQDGKIVRTKNYSYTKHTLKANGKVTIYGKDELNPFLSSEEKLSKEGLTGKTLEATITEIRYADGTSIKLLTEIPDEKTE